MSEADALDYFREQWRRELFARGVPAEAASGNGSKRDDKEPETNVPDGQQEAGCGSDDTLVNKSLQNVDDDDVLEPSYYPFLITGRLLREGTCCVSLSNPASDSLHTEVNRNYFSECTHCVDECLTSKKIKLDPNLLPTTLAQDPIPNEKPQKRLLDLFIADLDEITAVPFFDICLPREVALKIFQYLDVCDLCRCAQVSRSWQRIAEDDLLWCKICHRLGYEKVHYALDYNNWKSIVCFYVERKQRLITNFKGRVGRLEQLEHTKGGFLCAVNSWQDSVVAGFSNCEVKLWNLGERNGCTFSPSSTALVLDEASEEGTVENSIDHVITLADFTAAAYTHGFVDVWQNDAGTKPVYSCGGRGSITQLSLASLRPYLAVAQGCIVQLHGMNGLAEFCLVDTIDLNQKVIFVSWLEKNTCCSNLCPLLVAGINSVWLYKAGEAGLEKTELHNVYGAPISYMEVSADSLLLAVAFSNFSVSGNKVNIYDTERGQHLYTLYSHTAAVSCINQKDSPPFSVVTGCGDRKVRVFDLRISSGSRTPPIQTFFGHTARVSSVQMDNWKVVSGDDAGFVCVWDQRMGSQLWEWHNRHPVRYCHFHDRHLIVANISSFRVSKAQCVEGYDGLYRRTRGSLQVYDFLSDQLAQGVPENCLSTYDVPDGYNYNIQLAVPYDSI